MSEKINPVRGMNDLLPEASAVWQHVERTAAAVLAASMPASLHRSAEAD